MSVSSGKFELFWILGQEILNQVSLASYVAHIFGLRCQINLGTQAGRHILGHGDSGREGVSKSLNHCKGLLYCCLKNKNKKKKKNFPIFLM